MIIKLTPDLLAIRLPEGQTTEKMRELPHHTFESTDPYFIIGTVAEIEGSEELAASCVASFPRLTGTVMKKELYINYLSLDFNCATTTHSFRTLVQAHNLLLTDAVLKKGSAQ